MQTNNEAVATAIKRNILFGLLDQEISKNEAATRAGIPSSTFHRKLKNPEGFTLRELGQIAQALDRQLADILPSELLTTRRAA
jgi:DNA-binding Xre family transcriptional regulator